MVVRLGWGGGVLRTISTLAHLGPVYPIGFSMEHAPFVYRRHARILVDCCRDSAGGQLVPAMVGSGL